MPERPFPAAAFHWMLVESALGTAGVIAGEGGQVRRVVLPCDTPEAAEERVCRALWALRTSMATKMPRGSQTPPDATEPCPSPFSLPCPTGTGRPEEMEEWDSPSAAAISALVSAPLPPLPPEFARRDGPWASEAARQIAEYLHGTRRVFDLELDLSGVGGFSREALLAAAQIPFGQTRSYWWVAVRAGNPRAARAVGQAMASNPIPLILPCHRVVRADGTLGGFGGGRPELKRLLIEHERSLLSTEDRERVQIG